MLKLIGAALIVLATSLAGFEMARRLSERPRQLRIFKSALQALETEIMYGHTPLHEAARKLALQLPEPASSFFQTFAGQLTTVETTVKEAWEKSLAQIWGNTALKESEHEVLLQLGENLGKHDRYTEQKQIMLALTHLEREEKEAHERQMRYEKMAKSLGVLTGLLIVILLI
ncbi:stage III sporulation protein SpoAB [Weizmannia acidilactici]|uniref:Stage III sporulation protein SpoAB n=1 Tax=Weizmannia acidilactici TaxID=2607726 RepID=A0A5J4JD70_9BACI|nr:stage III sporulation protein SpoIIIAB [Weizmannia acidilactici]GER66145.1 stage III sporulation protein SpoAB [Weizmannia acidilactici]GER69219.1 stage III sporulation protein SpoAB [Weizmannia acidilactici]GER72454.1 stage III sporulation protein SpoAB [Weizmannia acidilactici]